MNPLRACRVTLSTFLKDMVWKTQIQPNHVASVKLTCPQFHGQMPDLQLLGEELCMLMDHMTNGFATHPIACALFDIPGISVNTIKADIMHVKHLGVDCWFLGSLFSYLCQYKLPGTEDENMKAVWLEIKNCYKDSWHHKGIRVEYMPYGFWSLMSVWFLQCRWGCHCYSTLSMFPSRYVENPMDKKQMTQKAHRPGWQTSCEHTILTLRLSWC